MVANSGGLRRSGDDEDKDEEGLYVLPEDERGLSMAPGASSRDMDVDVDGKEDDHGGVVVIVEDEVPGVLGNGGKNPNPAVTARHGHEGGAAEEEEEEEEEEDAEGDDVGGWDDGYEQEV
jgi:hypothetical protein